MKYFSFAAAVIVTVVLTACTDSEPPRSPAPEAVDTTVAYSCPTTDYRFTARFLSNSAWLSLPDTVLHLPQVVAASGIRYKGNGVTFWSKGDTAFIETPDALHTGCTVTASGGLSTTTGFRAIGQEPGWHLELRNDQITFTTDYGERTIVAPASKSTVDRAAGRMTYHAETEAHTLTVNITGTVCQDVMSGQRFPAAVRVTLDDTAYAGCGYPLP